ncbi:SMI1/KNR4 family protein [Kitasatospora sp. NBC_00315]|uniref:SMI1/KNR4 family protein n=1 Tax=Kitasatospora sp. NBC_00315 TaxID=2975963 RepID=UPI00324DA20A
MSRPLQRIQDILGEPERAVAPPPWDRCAAETGVVLPQDYRAFVDRYGSVRICNDLLVWVPSAQFDPHGFEKFVRANRFAEEDILLAYEDREEEIPFEIHPAPGGLLAWANNTKGDYCFWHTVGTDPDAWPVVVWIQDDLRWDVVDVTATELLADVVTGSYHLADILLTRVKGAPLWKQDGDWNGRF